MVGFGAVTPTLSVVLSAGFSAGLSAGLAVGFSAGFSVGFSAGASAGLSVLALVFQTGFVIVFHAQGVRGDANFEIRLPPDGRNGVA